ncbi:hypothetical protein RMQ97_13485 [Maricaulis sp. D1M11]|uniref:hypothetical protein n=1 Tax=Maricaulis sp. D1M11 TaxID=3076117 RepID=UPI0039B4291B
MSGRDLIGVFNLIIVVGILGVISYAAIILQPPEYDHQTLCVVDEIPPHRAVVIDKTDLYSPEQADRIAALIRAQKPGLAVGERLSLYELNESGQLANTNRFSLCNPGAGEQVNPLYRNPDRVQARYDMLFAEPLEAALADLVTPKNAPNSPIIEALAQLTQDPTFDRNAPRRHIVLVSDMLQNSDLFTVYPYRQRMDLTSRLPAPTTVAQLLRETYGDGLRGVTLEIRLIPRDPWQQVQQSQMRAYWDQVLRPLGVSVQWVEL